jgi:hypothetical protein
MEVSFSRTGRLNPGKQLQSRSGLFREEQNLFHLLGIEHRPVGMSLAHLSHLTQIRRMFTNTTAVAENRKGVALQLGV